jgi:hypothetical protein
LYACASCAFELAARSCEEHFRAHPPDLRRCRSCDRVTIQLAERNHRYSQWQPPGEVVDLYRYPHCGVDALLTVREDPSVMY